MMRAHLGQVNEERAPHRVARRNTKITEKGTVNKRPATNQESTTLKIHSSNFLILQDSERVRIQKNTKHKTFFHSVTNKHVTTTTGTQKLHITPSLEGKKKRTKIQMNFAIQVGKKKSGIVSKLPKEKEKGNDERVKEEQKRQSKKKKTGKRGYSTASQGIKAKAR